MLWMHDTSNKQAAVVRRTVQCDSSFIRIARCNCFSAGHQWDSLSETSYRTIVYLYSFVTRLSLLFMMYVCVCINCDTVLLLCRYDRRDDYGKKSLIVAQQRREP